jgi:hypothetical protein
MAFYGNSMWHGQMQPNNFANADVNAKQKRNPHSQSDSFLGAPLAVGANSPPAGPVSESMQMAGAKEGWENSTALGKTLSVTSSVAIGALMLPKSNNTSNPILGYGRSLLAGGVTFYVLNYMFDNLR